MTSTEFEHAILQAAGDLLLRPHCHRDRHSFLLGPNISLSTLFLDSLRNLTLLFAFV